MAKPNPKPSPSPGPKPMPVVKQSGPSEAKAANDKKYAAPKTLLPSSFKPSVPQSLKPPVLKPGDKGFIGPVASKKSNPISADAAERAATKTTQTAAALRKLTSGSKLTDAEKRLLGISVTPQKSNQKPKPDPKPKTKPKPKPKATGGSTGSNNSNDTGSTEESTGGDISATPNTPGSSEISPTDKQSKPASPDLILLNEEAFPIEVMTELLFEDMASLELLNFARHDTVNGINIKYHQISNLDKIETIYGGAKLIALQNTSEQVFSKYPLKRYSYIPDTTDDPSGFNSQVYLDSDGNLVIELQNLSNSSQIEVEFQSADTNDIIY
jgi:hypothetical protein